MVEETKPGNLIPESMKVTPMNAIKSQCHECLGHYADGMQDCENVKCTLYSYMPYRKQTPDLTWTTYNNKRKGLQIRTRRELSDEERKAISDRLQSHRAPK